MLRPYTAAAALLASVLVLASCGGADRSASPSAHADVTGARQLIQRFRRIPEFVAPGPSFAAARLRGKTIFEIPITSEVPFIQAVEQGMRQAAATVGAHVVVYPNQGRPTQWAQGIAAAIAQRADAITLFAQDPALLGPQIARAERAGIPVVVVRSNGEGEPCPRDAQGRQYGSACVPGPFEEAGRLQAAWAVQATGGSANVLVVTSRDARSTGPLVRGLRAEFARLCPGCSVRYVDVPIAEWATGVRTEVQSALVRDPDIDYVLPIYDSMSQYAVPAIVASGAAERVHIATFNGTPFVLGLLQRQEVVAMDAGENLAWVGWATVDQAFRVMARVRPVRSEHTPLRVFDAGNVAETGNPPDLDTGYGNAYVMGYRMLWRIHG
jgi:ribose transport system substrate-binding protein